jgi:hypothetical protein
MCELRIAQCAVAVREQLVALAAENVRQDEPRVGGP